MNTSKRLLLLIAFVVTLISSIPSIAMAATEQTPDAGSGRLNCSSNSARLDKYEFVILGLPNVGNVYLQRTGASNDFPSVRLWFNNEYLGDYSVPISAPWLSVHRRLHYVTPTQWGNVVILEVCDWVTMSSLGVYQSSSSLNLTTSDTISLSEEATQLANGIHADRQFYLPLVMR